MAQPAAVANTAQLRSVTSVPPARRSPSRRRQLQPVMHSLPSLPPSMLLATLHRIPMRIRCEWNVGTPSLALLLARAGDPAKVLSAKSLPRLLSISACCTVHSTLHPVRSSKVRGNQNICICTCTSEACNLYSVASFHIFVLPAAPRHIIFIARSCNVAIIKFRYITTNT